ncbi:MAG: hypothetical protein CMF50_05805 [Legionellales bacterium]|nr:hypothetical protein [Legionellales bacterium]|tara:strand:+ start:38173 stop:38487 length:315 start_codon:yes stop_codon:yes gene_type:complete
MAVETNNKKSSFIEIISSLLVGQGHGAMHYTQEDHKAVVEAAQLQSTKTQPAKPQMTNNISWGTRILSWLAAGYTPAHTMKDHDERCNGKVVEMKEFISAKPSK